MNDMNAQAENRIDKEALGHFDPEHNTAHMRPGINTEDKLPPGSVILYCTGWCPDCRRARAWLKDHRIEFKED